MNKLVLFLILILTTSISLAQSYGDPRMLTYFYLKSMKIDGNITYISSNREFSDIEFVFSESPFLLNTKVCNTGEISVLPDDFSFTLSGDFNFTGDPCQDSQVG